MPPEPLDYAIPPLKHAMVSKPRAAIAWVVVFAVLVAAMDVLLIVIGNDRSPGSFGGLVVLNALNPVGHLFAAAIFLPCSFLVWNRYGGLGILYLLVGIGVPLAGLGIVMFAVMR